ncbi:hypothetical protein MBM_03074 [Drepanopeziza brunnea f. sp. 'multigermtubi' MB_m1]|uniref:Uncharacterized protein n=1 Tax=Marssonina brunnea f. sp. multigermtubi (strain MB_m1) TaxID=1072389 RepID=K1X1D2_MARBU|nr:uncharacterized protein MBM_03074 [Drepanopeziza brunnea f. sp. 'multigermtubi' MB_m1]EKD18832.1 hypothetical protein MBM_03074 [Drepanopeziza brunnea f. sp. 'multigermtubi' MB_m1]
MKLAITLNCKASPLKHIQKITFESLIKDITDEARGSDSTKTINSQALYGNKSNLNSNSNNSNANNKRRNKNRNKGGNAANKSRLQQVADKRLDCKHYKQPKPLHFLKDYFVINKELRKAFEKRTSKKAILYFKRVKNKKGRGNNNKKKDDKEVNGEIFSYALLLNKEPLAVAIASSTAHYTSSNKNLRDTQGSIIKMKFKETKTSKTRVCALYKKGRFIRKTNKVLTRKRLTIALQELHVDIVHLTLIKIHGYKYALIFTCLATIVKLDFDNNLKETKDEEAIEKLFEPYRAPSSNDKEEVEEVEKEVVPFELNDKALTIRRLRKIYL